MEVAEIVLLVAGGIIFILSFLLPDRGEKNQTQVTPVAKEEVKELVGQEMEAVRGHVDDVVEEAVSYAMEKTERSLERLSNEKIMAINEYSDTVLSEIHRNHEEAMFLYDMLNSKHTNLKNTVSEVDRTMKEAEETVNRTVREAEETVNRTVKEAEEAVSSFQKLVPERVAMPERVAVLEPVAVPEPVAGLERVAVPERITVPEPVAGLEHVAVPERIAVPEPVTGLERVAMPERSAVPMTALEKLASEHSETPKAAFVRLAEQQMAQAVMEEKPMAPELGRPEETAVEEEHSGNFNYRILELYRKGMDRVGIARELGLGVGEVKLVLDLFEGNEKVR